MRYSGSVGKMDAVNLNKFLEISDNHKINSGEMKDADFNVSITNGIADGILNIQYDSLSIAVLDAKTGSDKGIINKISSLIGKWFVIKGENLPGDRLKVGKVHYIRNPHDSFIQVLWFALRSGLKDVVGF
jgi:hypothetical protein